MSLKWYKDGNSMISMDRRYCVCAFKYAGEWAYRAYRLRQVEGLGCNLLLEGPVANKDKCFEACENDAKESSERSGDQSQNIADVFERSGAAVPQ